MPRALLAVLVATASGAAHPGPARAAECRADPTRSHVTVNVSRSGAFASFLHDHHFSTSSLDGTVDFDPDRPAAVQGALVVPARSLKEVHSELSPADQRKVYAQLEGPAVLDAAAHPEIRFVIQKFLPSTAGDLSGELWGALTLRGATRPVRFMVRGRASEGELHVTGQGSFRQSDFGITPLHQMFGAIQVKDDVSVDFDVFCVPGGER